MDVRTTLNAESPSRIVVVRLKREHDARVVTGTEIVRERQALAIATFCYRVVIRIFGRRHGLGMDRSQPRIVGVP